MSEEYLKTKAEVVGKIQSYQGKYRSAEFELSIAQGKLKALKEELQMRKEEISELKQKKENMKSPLKIPSEFLASRKLAQNKVKFSPHKKKQPHHTANSKSLTLLK